MLRGLVAVCVITTLLAAAGVLDAQSATSRTTPRRLCRARHAGEKCVPGHGHKVAPCARCVSHKGWPRITGVRWQVISNLIRPHRFKGGPANDELLGRHGSDVISGEGGDDVIWGDSQPVGNDGRQRDDLRGGPGDDWIYASHGFNRILAGAGNDHITLYYGRGRVDCGPGHDVVRIGHLAHHYALHRCERVIR